MGIKNVPPLLCRGICKADRQATCEKAPCTDLRSDPTLHQNSYRTTQADAYVNHAHQTQAQRVCYLIKLNTGSLSCQENCFTLDSHMLTSDSFFSLQTQHDQSQGNTNTTNRETRNKTTKQRRKVCSLCRSVFCQVRWHSSSCSLNELLTPLPWADVSTGKLDSRFPVNKPQVLQIKVCWNNSSCYKSTN